jgi:hypothetical protein
MDRMLSFYILSVSIGTSGQSDSERGRNNLSGRAHPPESPARALVMLRQFGINAASEGLKQAVAMDTDPVLLAESGPGRPPPSSRVEPAPTGTNLSPR